MSEEQMFLQEDITFLLHPGVRHPGVSFRETSFVTLVLSMSSKSSNCMSLNLTVKRFQLCNLQSLKYTKSYHIINSIRRQSSSVIYVSQFVISNQQKVHYQVYTNRVPNTSLREQELYSESFKEIKKVKYRQIVLLSTSGPVCVKRFFSILFSTCVK